MSFMKAAWTQGEQLLESANKWHQTVVLWTIVGVIFAVTAGVLANIAGFPKFNFLLAAAALLAGTFFLTKPAIVLSVFGLGSLTSGLPDIKLGEILRNGVGSLPNFELKKVLGAGWNVVQSTAHKVAHVFFLVTVFFVVLGTFPISDPVLVLPAIVILTGVGLWAALFTKGHVWYKRITFGLLVVSGIVVFFQLYDPQGKIERIEEAQATNQERLIDEGLDPILRKAEHGIKLTPDEEETLDAAKKREEERSVVAKAKAFVLGQVIEYRVPSNIAPENLKPICGIPPGEYEFDLGGSPHLTLVVNDPESGVSRTTLNIADWSKAGRGGVSYPEYIPGGALLNDVPMRGKVVIGENGCARIRFNWPESEIDYFRNGIFKIESTTLRILLK